MHHSKFIRSLALFSFVLFAGCSKPIPNDPGVAAHDKDRPPVAVGLPITDKECEEFGKKVESAVALSDRNKLLQLFQMNALFDRALQDLPQGSGFLNGAKQGATEKSREFAEAIIATAQNGGKYSMRWGKNMDGQPHVLMRLLSEDTGINYHDITLGRGADGSLVVLDLLPLNTGESLGQAFRRLMLIMTAEQNRGILDRLQGKERLWLNNMQKLSELTRLVREKKNAEALKVFDSLPAEVQKEKLFQSIAIDVAKEIDQERYFSLMQNFRRDHPNDPAIELMLIDYNLLKKKHDDAIRGIDHLDKLVGGDPYLWVMRGNVYFDAGRNAEAKKAFETAIQDEKFDDAYWSRITVALRENNHTETLAWLKRLETETLQRVDFEIVKTNVEYERFLKTPEFQEFCAWHNKRK